MAADHRQIFIGVIPEVGLPFWRGHCFADNKAVEVLSIYKPTSV